MLKRFGEYVLGSRWSAAMMALLFGFIPLFGWVSTVIIGLVTLRRGPSAGLWIVCWASVSDVVAALIGYPDAILFGIVGGNVFVWLMSWVLWLTASWVMVLEATLLFGVVGVIAAHLVMPDIVGWWLAKYQALIGKSYEEAAWMAEAFGFANAEDWSAFVDAVQQSNVLEVIAKISTGLITAFVLGVRLIKLVLARWWQSLLFNPDGLKPELYEVRLGYVAVVAVMVSLLGIFANVDIAWDVIPLFVLVFLLAGLSLIHCLAARVKTGIVWLLLLYVLMVVLTPYCIVAVVTMALVDSIFNVRQRVGSKV